MAPAERRVSLGNVYAVPRRLTLDLEALGADPRAPELNATAAIIRPRGKAGPGRSGRIASTSTDTTLPKLTESERASISSTLLALRYRPT